MGVYALLITHYLKNAKKNFSNCKFYSAKDWIVHEFLTPEKVQSQHPRFNPYLKYPRVTTKGARSNLLRRQLTWLNDKNFSPMTIN